MKPTIAPLLILLLFCLLSFGSYGQAKLSVTIKDSASQEAIIGAAVRLQDQSSIGAATNVLGVATINNLRTGKLNLLITAVGYPETVKSVDLAAGDNQITILLVSFASETEEIIVTSTRTISRLEDAPMKIEVLGEEELNEEAAIVPGNVASILGDISIIHIQKLSPVTGNQGIRMQGLDVKYTQLLRDGLPLYEGFSGNLGVLQIPPLDLRQVEIIKGSVSTLYGGGAIGGLVNLVSKTPKDKPELTAILNRSSLRETNLNTYYAQRFGKFGFNLLAAGTVQDAVDVNGDGFSDSPQIQNLTIHPRLFYDLSPHTKVNVGYTLVAERRAGGDVEALKSEDSTHRYVNISDVLRHTIDYNLQQNLGKHDLTFKGAGSFFDRQTNDTGYVFKGNQTMLFTELSDRYDIGGGHVLVGGVNFTSEAFVKSAATQSPIADFTYQTIGVFLQDNWLIGKLTLQPGMRVDLHNTFGQFLLPTIAAIYRFTDQYSLRANIGTGYKTPNAFNLATPLTSQVKSGLQYLDPIVAGTKAERSVGYNLDFVAKRTLAEGLTFQLDQAVFYTQVTDPMVAVSTSEGRTQFVNADFNISTIGTDTYLRFDYKNTECYFGFNHTVAQRESINLPFAPQNKFSTTLAYNIPSAWRFGVEASWVGNQYIYDNAKVPNYWFFAAMVERALGPVHIILNCENLFNVRQSDFGQVVSGTRSRPSFVSIWAPQEGIIVNLAVKWTLERD